MRKVLIVDDDGINRALLTRILKDEYEVLQAENGQVALEMLREGYAEISAVLLDLVMPVLDGYGVVTEMQKDDSLSNIPVIITTGNSEVESEVKALSIGANDFIIKPYNPAVIRHRLANTIRLRETAAIVNATRVDALTGLPSRFAFFEKAEEMISAHPPGYYVLSCLDIDSFKVINDQYGNERGDEVLKTIARIMREGFEPIGGICCRINADNFAVIYPADCPEEMLSRLHDKMSHNSLLSRPISLSVGRYNIIDTSLKINLMYDRAMIAKLTVKGLFDRRVAVYDESMRERILREQRIVNEMGSALKTGQFEMWLQPQYNHATGALVGSEALIRWRHPERGLIPPGSFIPVFERNGFVYEADKFIWEQACITLRRWTDEGRNPLPISVNISRYDLFRDDFIEVLTGLVKKYSLPVELLRLEVTESAFAESPEHIIAVVKQLIGFGFTIEIDDFGSGYSSLNTLKDVPASILKLDMRFLESCEDSGRGGNILESIVRMAKWLGMSIIAEGVETKIQADFLKSIGCMYVQGFLYSKPIPVADYERISESSPKESSMSGLETVENLDNNSFWNPESMDTLIFNSYVGGACIFEFVEGKTELLRVNDKYTRALMGDAPQQAAMMINIEDYMDDESRSAMKDNIVRAIETNEESACETRLFGLPNGKPITYLLATVRAIARADKRYLFYGTINDITSQREAEQHERETAVRLSSASAQLQEIMNNIDGGVTAVYFKDGEFHYIYANDQYFTQLGYTREQYENEVKSPFDPVHPEDRDSVIKNTLESQTSAQPFSCTYRVIRRDGRTVWLSSKISMTSLPGFDGPVQLAVANDVTSEMESAIHAKEASEQFELLGSISADMLSAEDSDKAINGALEKMLGYFGAMRAYVFEFNDAKQVISNTYEVCSVGATPEIDNLKSVPYELCRFWLHTFDNDSYISIDDVEKLGGDRQEEREVLSQQNIRSLIAVPLRRNNKNIGFVGIDDPSCNKNHVDRLVAIGDYIAVMLTRRDLNAKIASDNETLKNLMDGTPGGFARIRINGDKSICDYVNKGLCSLLGYSAQELIDRFSADRMWAVLPEQREYVNEYFRQISKGAGSCTLKHALVRNDGRIIWVNVYSRVSHDADNTFLNVYFSDVTEEEAADRHRNRLLENLPCGAAIIELDSHPTVPVFYNNRYLDTLGCDTETAAGKPLTDFVHPDDRERFISSLNKTDASSECDIRIYNGRYKKYNPFRVVISSDSDSDGVRSDYLTFTPISETELSFREMLPVALRAMMESPTDLSCVKDRNLEYICCSSAYAKMVGLADKADIAGKTDYELTTKEIADRHRAEDLEIIKTGEPRMNVIAHSVARDGTERYASISKYPLRDNSGNILGIYCSMNDITEFRQAYGRLQLLTDSIPGGIAVFNVSGRNVKTIYMSSGAYALSGFTKEECAKLGYTSALDVVFPDDMDALLTEILKLEKPGAAIDCSYRIYTRTGGIRWVSLRGNCGARTEDSVTVNAVLLDITKEKNSDIALAESRKLIEQTNTLINDSSSSVYVCDTENYELLYVNGSAARMCGKTVEDARGKRCYEYLKNANEPCVPCYKDFCNRECYTEKEFTSPMSGKSYLTRGRIIDWNGRRALVENMTDETERINARKSLHDLINRIPSGIGIYNCYDDGRIEQVFLNDGYYSMLGTRREARNEYGGFSVLYAIHPDDMQTMRDEVISGIKEKRRIDIDLRVMDGSGEYRWLNISAAVVSRMDDHYVLYACYADIERLKRIQERLAASRLAVEIAGTGGQITLWLYDPEKKQITYDFGTPSCVTESHVLENVPEGALSDGVVFPEDADAFTQMFKNINEGRISAEATVRLKNVKNGRYEWRHIICTRIGGENGKHDAIGFSINADLQQEILQRYERELQLRRELVKNSDHYYQVNLTTGVVEEYISQGDSSIGIVAPCRTDDNVRQALLAGVVEEDRETVRNTVFIDSMLAAHAKGKDSLSVVYRVNIGENRRRWLRCDVSIIKRPGSDELIAFLNCYNIDNEKKEPIAVGSIMDEEIESVAILNTDTSKVRQVSVSKDLDKTTDGECFELTAENLPLLIGQVLDEDTAVCDEFFNVQAMCKNLEKEPIIKLTYRIKSPDGRILRKKARAFYLDDTHEDVIIVRRDITDLYEEEQRQKQILQQAVDSANSANNAKSEFLSRMSHDMRTPLNAILSFSDDEMTSDSDDVGKSAYLKRIHASGEYLQGIINDVLDMSKIESKKMQLNPEPYNIRDFVKTVDTVIGEQCRKKGIDFLVDLSQRPIEWALLDKTRFNQVFMNLLSNAVKFTPNGGKIEFTMQHVSGDDTNCVKRFTVRDTGIGMSPEFLPHAFDSFSQEYRPDAPEHTQGTGLGLSIVKQIVDLMKGSISVESELNKGTAFTVDLPITTIPDHMEKVRDVENLGGLEGLRILMCEDNPINTEIVVRLLTKRGCSIDCAENGLMGLEKYRASADRHYDAVLMDIRMPKMNGIEAAAQIRKSGLPDSKTIPIIALTADAFNQDEQTARDAGMNALVSKPIKPMLLYKELLRFTRGKESSSVL